MDILSRAQRSAVMSRIQGKDTEPELVVRRLAHGMGFRYQLHRRDLPGSPDLVFPGLGTIIFVHGCYWHRHKGCRYAYSPKSNVSFWRRKFDANVERDRVAILNLKKAGWCVYVVWECETEEAETLKRRLLGYLKRGKRRRQERRFDATKKPA
jgi:DNA mismatch endonuclease, patch repair protein